MLTELTSCKCPGCDIRLSSLKEHSEHLKTCLQTNVIPDSRITACVACGKHVLTDEYEPKIIRYNAYAKSNICGMCKYLIHDVSHMISCNKKSGPSVLCASCKQKDISGILKRFNILKTKTKNKNFKLCPNCFAPSSVITGCNHVTCNVCSVTYVFGEGFTNANISDSELAQILGPDEPTELSEFYTTEINRQVRERDVGSSNTGSSAPSCGLKTTPNTTVVHNSAVSEKPQECGICMTNPEPVCLEPCKHWCCLDCIVNSGKQECPWCRSNVMLYLLKKANNL